MRAEELIKAIEEHTRLTYTDYLDGDEDEYGDEITEEKIRRIPNIIADLERQRDEYFAKKKEVLKMMKDGKIDATPIIIDEGQSLTITGSSFGNVAFFNDGKMVISNNTFKLPLNLLDESN